MGSIKPVGIDWSDRLCAVGREIVGFRRRGRRLPAGRHHGLVVPQSRRPRQRPPRLLDDARRVGPRLARSPRSRSVFFRRSLPRLPVLGPKAGADGRKAAVSSGAGARGRRRVAEMRRRRRVLGMAKPRTAGRVISPFPVVGAARRKASNGLDVMAPPRTVVPLTIGDYAMASSWNPYRSAVRSRQWAVRSRKRLQSSPVPLSPSPPPLLPLPAASRLSNSSWSSRSSEF